MPISLLVPDLPGAEDLLPYLKRIDAARWYTNFGPLVRELEARIETLFSDPKQHAVSVSNATLGLEVAVLALQLPPGSRVLMPALTFVATATAAQRAGCVPVFCDVDPRTWLLTPEIADEAIRHVRVDAIMPVSTYGCPCDVAAWDQLCEHTGIPIVIDAAGAYGNQGCGSRSTVVFSLHATKSFAAAEGGLVLSPDPAYAERVRRLTNFGIDRSADSSGLVNTAGTNAKLSEYHAAIGLAALDRWSASSQRRIALHVAYLRELAGRCPGVRLQARATDGVYSILPVLLPEGAAAARAFGWLRARDIETRRWYCPPLTDHPAFASSPVAGPLDVCTTLGDRLLALPFHAFLSAEDVGNVTGALAEFLREPSSGEMALMPPTP